MSLYIKPISALLTHDTELFSNMDPYVVIEIGNDKKKTRTHNEGGKKPQWSDILIFKNLQSMKMVVTVMDEDVVTDDKVGAGAVDLSKIINDPIEHKEYIALTYKGRPAGKIYMSMKYVVSGNSQNSYGNSNNSGWSNNNNANNNNNNSDWKNLNNNSSWGSNNNTNNGWGNNNNIGVNNNSGWGNNNLSQQPPPETAFMAQQFAQQMKQNNPNSNSQGFQPPINNKQGNVLLNALQGVLQGNTNPTSNSFTNNNPASNNNNSGWGNNNNNNGWGPNNNGWGNNNTNNNSGW